MIAFPPAKINLGLHITGRLQDGYHTLETLFYPINWCDILEIVLQKNDVAAQAKVQFHISGLIPEGPADHNLCIKAYNLLDHHFQLPPVIMYLHKQLPSGAGLGGGSSDAAHTLLLLNKLFDLKQDQQQLSTLALQLGADCPFFISGMPAYATGKGQVLEPAADLLKGDYVMVIKPPLSISTAYAYSKVSPQIPKLSLKQILQLPKHAWRHHLANDFEQNLFIEFPELQQLKDNFYQAGAYYASMSGSGSAVYGLFHQNPDMNIPTGYLGYTTAL
jgi:4-diphosphocytidyl-2-C-methyl-D-erythritol kinase